MMSPQPHAFANRPNFQASTQAATSVLSPQFVWKTFQHWWKVIIPVAIVLTVGANLLIYWRHVPEYRAFSRLRIKASPDSILGQSGGSGRGQNFANNQLAIIRSELVLEPVIAKPDVAKIPEIGRSRDPVAKLSKELKVAPIGRSEYYEISYSHPNPKSAALIVDEVVKSYLALFGDIEDRRTTSIERLLQDEKSKREGQVQRLEDTLRNLARKASVQLEIPVAPNLNVHPGQVLTNQSQGMPFGQELGSLYSERATAELDRIVLNSQIKDLELEFEKPIVIPASAIDPLVEQNAGVMELTANLAAAHAKFAEAQRNAADKDPAKNSRLQPYQRDIDNHQKALEDTRAALRTSIEAKLRTDKQYERQAKLDDLYARQKNLNYVIAALNERYDQEVASVKELASETMLDIEFTRMELGYAQEMLGTINSRLMQLDVQKNEPSQVEHVLEKARVPSEPNELIPMKKMALASGATFFLPLLLALLWEIRVRRISNVQELEANTCQLPVVAEVTRLPVRASGQNGSVRLQQDLWLFEESVETLRTCLMLSEPGSGVQVIAVTSAAAREGKTSVASQLAVSLAGSTEQRTLLIDGDMRSPDVHGIFDVESEYGLTNVLAKEVTLEEAVNPTWHGNLDILSAGQLTCSPHNLLGNGAFRQLLETARAKYSFIVIDTPPILAASEALIMAKDADAALLCAMRSVSRTHQVRSAHARLQQSGAKPVGLVLNGVPTQSYYYKYGKYSYSRD